MPRGSFYVPDEDSDTLLSLLVASLEKGEVVTLAEKPEESSPLRVDVDIATEAEGGLKRRYDAGLVRRIVLLYQEEIRNVSTDLRDEHLWCVLLEKKSPRVEGDRVRDGFHLHFPFFACEKRSQDTLFRDVVVPKMVGQGIWDGRGVENPASLIDSWIGTKPWLTYGSTNYKGPWSSPYLCHGGLGGAFDHDGNETSVEAVLGSSKPRDIAKALRIRGVRPPPLKVRNVPPPRKFHERRSEDVAKDLSTVVGGEIMEMIGNWRADDRNSWMDVGWTLFNVGQGCSEALDLWIEFSKRSPKFVDGECERLWEAMEPRGKTIGSLLAMAKKDSPELFKAWRDRDVTCCIESSLMEPVAKEHDVAMVFKALYKDRFVCVDSKGDSWYEFRDHRWREVDNAIVLKRLVVGEVKERYYAYKRDQAIAASTESDEVRRARYNLLEGRAIKAITKLKTVKFVNDVVKMCQTEMYDGTFRRKKDEGRMIVVCENGVLDLEQGVFRSGRPDDFATMSTRIFAGEVPEADAKALDDFLLKVFPNKDIRNYFLDVATTCLQGGNIHKRFIVATGTGDNGKTVTFKLLGMAFGDYLRKVPRSLLIRGRGTSSSSARPEIAQVQGRRIIATQEISTQEDLDVGVLKELTGNDTFFARTLWDKGGEIKPMFTLWMQCNALPKIPGSDEATWSRVRVLKFESKFVKPQDLAFNPVADTSSQRFSEKKFEANPNIDDDLKRLAPALLWKIFLRFPVALVEPKEVMEATNEYRACNDVFAEFLAERVVKAEREEAGETYVTNKEMYAEFQEWYKENHPYYARTSKIGKSSMKSELKARLGTTRREGDLWGFGKQERWWGYRIVETPEEVGLLARASLVPGNVGVR